MNAGPRISSYEWAGRRESMLCFGPENGPTVVLALPLFEEANRTRAFGVAILRALAARGVGGVLPELPGQGESEIATEHATLAELRAAFAAAPGTHAAAIRSGALLLHDHRPSWRLAPQDGPELVRELARVKGASLDGDRVEVAGNLLPPTLVPDLRTATLASALPRTVRLSSDARPADRHVDGPPLWRRAEPDSDSAFAQMLAADIADWIAACER